MSKSSTSSNSQTILSEAKLKEYGYNYDTMAHDDDRLQAILKLLKEFRMVVVIKSLDKLMKKLDYGFVVYGRVESDLYWLEEFMIDGLEKRLKPKLKKRTTKTAK